MKFSKFHVCLVLFLMLCGCSSDNPGENASRPAPVRIALAREGNMVREIRAVGNVQPSASVALTPRVTGEIQKVEFEEGADVIAGQPLIYIDPRPYEAILREKQALLAKSEAELAKAIEDRRRFARLADNGYVSREAYEQSATDAAALRATTLANKAAVESATLNLTFCKLIAPISGRVGSLKVHKGNMVKSDSQEPIVNIDAISPSHVYFSVPEVHLPAIMDRLEAGQLNLTATPTGGKPETGKLDLIENQVDVKTGTIRLRGIFENTDRRLWPGQFVSVTLPLGVAENALIVPSRALQPGRENSYIYIVDEDNRARAVPARSLFETGGETAILADIKPGQKVIVEGQVRLAPNTPVEIMN